MECYEACQIFDTGVEYYQFDMRAIRILEETLALCPTFAYAYYEIAVVYLKAGNFVGWTEYMDQAVALDPENFLGVRASCRATLHGDYQKAIEDINQLEKIIDYDMGTIHDGSYHLRSFRAWCHKNLGQFDEAVATFNAFAKEQPEDIGYRDYLHLGVALMQLGQYQSALDAFARQKEMEDFAESYYYSALCHKALDNNVNYLTELDQSLVEFNKGNELWNPFRTCDDEIFISDIKAELLKAEAYR